MQNAPTIKEKNQEIGLKILNICSSKDTDKKKKRQGTEWEKIFIIQISDKGLVFRLYFKKNNSTVQ